MRPGSEVTRAPFIIENKSRRAEVRGRRLIIFRRNTAKKQAKWLPLAPYIMRTVRAAQEMARIYVDKGWRAMEREIIGAKPTNPAKKLPTRYAQGYTPQPNVRVRQQRQMEMGV